MSIRPVKRIIQSKPTIEGAGVQAAPRLRLRRHRASSIRSCCSTISATTVPTTTCAGFPWHPHRGIETITYVLAGTVEHGDSLGNRGALGAGDVQWMTAGSGIMHQEMPKGDAQGRMHGFQLWANLPSSLKMTAPRYQDVKAADIPEVTDDDGTQRARRLRRLLGQDAARSKASPPIRATSTSRCRRASARRLPVEIDAARLRLRLRGLRHVPRRVASRSAC